MKRIKAIDGQYAADNGDAVAGGVYANIESVVYMFDGRLIHYRKNTQTNKVTWWQQSR